MALKALARKWFPWTPPPPLVDELSVFWAQVTPHTDLDHIEKTYQDMDLDIDLVLRRINSYVFGLCTV